VGHLLSDRFADPECEDGPCLNFAAIQDGTTVSNLWSFFLMGLKRIRDSPARELGLWMLAIGPFPPPPLTLHSGAKKFDALHVRAQ